MGKMFEENSNPKFTPIYNDAESGVPLRNPSPHTDGIQNQFELKITPYKELNSFTRRFLLLLMFIQTFLLMTLVTYLFVRVSYLERETSRLSTLANERQTKLFQLSDQVNEVRTETQNLIRTDCRMFNDINLTDSEKQDLILNVEVETEINEDDNGKETNQKGQKEDGKGTTLIKRFQCQKCISRDNPRLVNRNTSRTPPVLAMTSPGDARALNFKRSLPESLPTEKDVAAVLLKGGLPEILITDKGNIGPWFFDRQVEPASNQSQDFRIPSNRSCVHVLTDGFYFIYAQVYYLSDGGSNSFSIIKSGSDRRGKTIATCSSGRTTASRDHKEEVSCFTATVAHLRAGDALHLTEREMNRQILFRDGQTYFGITRLALLPPEDEAVASATAPSTIPTKKSKFS